MHIEVNLRIQKVDRVKILDIGAIGGFTATLAIVALILVGETVMMFPRGMFYNVLDNMLGASGAEATNLGLFLYFVAGTLIGVVSAAPLAAVRRVYALMGRLEKRLAYGMVTGFLVWVLFVPVSYLGVAPVIEHLGEGFLDVSGRLISTDELSAKFPIIIIAALAFTYSMVLYIQ